MRSLVSGVTSAASVGNRAPPYGGGASGGVLPSASDDDGGGLHARLRERPKKIVQPKGG